MILKSPTGSFKLLLPKGPEDPTSVIYAISNNDPPRADQYFIKIPDGVKYKVRGDRLVNDTARRKTVGDLIFTTKAASPTKVLSGVRLFSWGQLLDFGDTVSDTIVPQTVGDKIETKHNNNYLDTQEMGIGEEEQDLIDQAAVDSQKQLLDEIDVLQKRKKTLEADIQGYQKSINEIDKMLAGLKVILSTDNSKDIREIKNKLTIKKAALTEQMNADIAELNTIPAQVEEKRNALLALTELVK